MGYQPSGIMLFDTKKTSRIRRIDQEKRKKEKEPENCIGCGAPRNRLDKCEYCGRIYRESNYSFVLYADDSAIERW